MSDAEVKDLNQISKKDIYHTPSGKYIQFIHDHSEKTFDAWELLPDGSHRLLESQSTTIETFDEFKQKIIGKTNINRYSLLILNSKMYIHKLTNNRTLKQSISPLSSRQIKNLSL